MAKTVIWAAVLLTYGVSTGAAMDNCKPGPSTSSRLPLDMAPDSVDDMYDGCREDMVKVATGVLQNERNKDIQFKQAWGDAEKQYNKKRMKPRLGREQVIAIYVYTFISGNMYLTFNDAVRTEGPQYKTTFKFHALHFYLTDAIQQLHARRLDGLQEGEDKCLTVYRRVDSYFYHAVNMPVRFGSFTSTSLGRYPKAERFGEKSCFEIVTCMGADVSIHSKYENEAEVLIPPYEVFKVMKIKKRSEQPGLPCEVVYELQSSEEAVSHLNCAFSKK